MCPIKGKVSKKSMENKGPMSMVAETSTFGRPHFLGRSISTTHICLCYEPSADLNPRCEFGLDSFVETVELKT